jgi:hypothetical protein
VKAILIAICVGAVIGIALAALVARWYLLRLKREINRLGEELKTARRDLADFAGLDATRAAIRAKAEEEQRALKDTSDSGLAHRANSLFR